MREVTVRKDELLKILKENQKKHRELFLEAVEGYKKEALEWLNTKITAIKQGKTVALIVTLHEPYDCTDHYDTKIKMLEMSVHDEITLDDQEFKFYVLDQWDWARKSLTSNTGYTVR